MKISPVLMTALMVLASSLYANDYSDSRSLMRMDGGQNYRQSQDYRTIHTEALSRVVRSANPTVVIIDARNRKTDDGKRIPSAKAIPFDAPNGNITANLPDKQVMIIVYCANAQCNESNVLVDRLIRMGYTNVWKYPEGIEEWEKSGKKVEQDKTAGEAAAETGPKAA
jgi:rhodanese-related sulfurtransferase